MGIGFRAPQVSGGGSGGTANAITSDANPTIDSAGEIAVNTTSGTVNYFDGTAEAVLSPINTKAFSIESPTDAEDRSLFYTDVAITVSQMVAVLVGSSTPSVTWTIRHATDRSGAGNEVVTSGTTTTSTTSGSVVTSFNDATIPADSFIWFETSAQSGTVDELSISIDFTVDP